MLELEQAVEQVLGAMPSPSPERIALAEACDRVLLERVLAPLDLPLFDNSSMDGYAVRAAEVALAKPDSPVRLRLAGKTAAGESFPGELPAGACVRLFTGSPLPAGADAIVMQEDTRPGSQDGRELLVFEAVKAGENVRCRGEDVRRGAVLVDGGQRLTGAQLGLLAAAGQAQVTVGRRPVAALLATGSELREPGQALAPSQVYESNRIGLTALARRAGANPKVFPLVADLLSETRAALLEALEECDVVITSGGVSVGELDLVKQAFTDAGGELQFWKVAMRPGRPFVFGRWRGKSLFGLPGNPVSAFVTFLLLVRPALLRWQGAASVSLPAHPGILAEPLENSGERRHFLRVKVDAAGAVHLAGPQGSHRLNSLAAANGLVDVPPATVLPTGTRVPVIYWD